MHDVQESYKVSCCLGFLYVATTCDAMRYNFSAVLETHESDVENCTMLPVVGQNRNNLYSQQRAAMRPKMSSRQSKTVTSQVLATYCEPAFTVYWQESLYSLKC